MADGSITFSTALDNKQLEMDLAKLKKKIDKEEQEIADVTRKREAAAQKGVLDGAELDAEKAKLQEIKDRLRDIRNMVKDKSAGPETREHMRAQLPAVQEELADQQARVRALQAEWNKTEAAVERYDQKIAEARDRLDRQKDTAGALVQQLDAANGASARMGRTIDQAGTHLDRFTGRIKKLMSRAFVFTIISSGLRAMRDWMGKAVKTNSEAAAAMAKLKGALLTLAQPLVNVVIPAFIMLVNVLTKVAFAAASVMSKLFGTTVEQSAQAAKGLNDEMNALEGVGDAAKKAGKSMASFDEINQVEDASSGAGGAAGEIAPDFDTSFISGELDGLSTLLAGALLAIGAILTFSGANIPLGLGLMAAGAAALAVTVAENWGAIEQALQGPLGVVTLLVSGALLALGAVLAFSGVNLPLGIALMAAGAVGLAATIAANWNTISENLVGETGLIIGIISGALLVIGAVLLFTGANIPLGLGLLAAGALGLATSIAANWETVQNELQGPVGAVLSIIGGALLVIGVILLFTGAAVPLGLGLLAAGAVALGTAITANWETVQNELQGPIGTVVGMVSAALLALGAILLFTGAAIPLGIGLIAVGAVGLATAIAANWDTVQTALQGPIGTVTALVSAALLALGVILLFTGAALPLGLGLIAVGAIGLATTIAANWETVQNALGGPIGAVTAMVSAALLVLGVILLFTGAAIPLGLGLIVAGGAGLAATIAPNWDFILEAVSGAFENMIRWWDGNAAQFFSLEYWAGLAGDMLDGLFGGLDELGSRISEWGGSFIDGVKDFFGIHSPSTEFEGLGGYMMAGLQNGVGDNSEMVVSTFSVMFTAVTALCTQNTDLMKTAVVAFLLYLTKEFEPQWMKSWQNNYQNAHSSIQMVMGCIDALNQKLASIERNITITITTVRREISEGGSSSGGTSSSSAASRLASIPAVHQASIPALAQGAVIPPNRAFMAVLGDQKRGTNIEAPADLIRQMVMEGIRAAGGSAGGRDLTVIMQLDRQTLGRVVYRLNNEETQRVGVSFEGVSI